MKTKPLIDLKRIRGGDIEAFKALFESFYVPLRSFAANYVPLDTAADMAQEALIKYWQRRENFEHINQVRTFLYNTTRNAVLNELAHNKVVMNYHKQSAESDSHAPQKQQHNKVIDSEYYEIQSEVMRRLRDEIAALPKRMRQIMELTLTGIRNADIANELGIKHETVRSLKKTAYKKLRLNMSDYKEFISGFSDITN
jgi:RNA polymerase sigma-70 factor (ECF subfamily)